MPSGVYTRTPEAREKLRVAGIGRKHTPETRAKQSAAAMGNTNGKGRVVTAETRANLSAALKGHKVAAETRVKQSAWKRTPKLRAKIRAARIGSKATPETRAKMCEAHIGLKATPETIAKLSGPNNHCWRGGLSNEPYPAKFNGALKKAIRVRDNYTCRMCSKTQKQNGRALDVHHKDRNKDNLELNNLISLCMSCHHEIESKLRQVS